MHRKEGGLIEQRISSRRGMRLFAPDPVVDGTKEERYGE
jgi:hypothetical protein